MEHDRGADRLRSFLLGGLLGASAVLATARRRRRRLSGQPPAGLAAFEDAPCYRELAEAERSRES